MHLMYDHPYPFHAKIENITSWKIGVKSYRFSLVVFNDRTGHHDNLSILCIPVGRGCPCKKVF
jgi:hypothetical protein